MTELNLVYGGNDLNNDFQINNKTDIQDKPRISGQQIYQLASQEGKYEDQLPQMPQMQAPQMQQTAPQMQQTAAPQMQYMQQIPPQYQEQMQYPQQNYKRRVEYSFLDRMNLKKSEVIKLSLFSLVIVLGIAIERIGTHYLSKYVSENVLTDFQEFLLRLSYPILIFLLLWILKAA
jgi:hypothetical protein